MSKSEGLQRKGPDFKQLAQKSSASQGLGLFGTQTHKALTSLCMGSAGVVACSAAGARKKFLEMLLFEVRVLMFYAESLLTAS